MTVTEFVFEGGSIFNNRRYPSRVLKQSIPVLKQMGKNVDLKYATVDVAGAERDLASQGYSMRHTSSTDTMKNINAWLIADRIADMLTKYFEENIQIKSGGDRILTLIQHTLDNQIAETEDNFFSSSEGGEGHYFSYQLTFYSMRKASFCFIVLSLLSFNNQSSAFGIPTKFDSGIAYNAQVFECKEISNNFLYNFGHLQSGESLVSLNGKHIATLSRDGNLAVDSRWETSTSGRGTAPYYLVMQEDANLVIYDGKDEPTWASQTEVQRFSESPWLLEMQDDGNLVIYDSKDSALWAIGI